MDSSDLSYEESILRDPYSLTHWLTYLEYKGTRDLSTRWLIYERALRVMPGSYKLWLKYLKERISHTVGISPASPLFEEINNVFERCLIHLHKMPVIWTLYLDFLQPQHRLTHIRRTFDRMLTSIAVTQHDKWVWTKYLTWAKSCGVAETGIRIYKRYLKIAPDAIEDYIKFLKHSGRIEDAVLELTRLVNDENFVSQKGKSKYDLWSDLLKLLLRNPVKMSQSARINVDAIIRSGLTRFAHDVGRLWTSLANYYIRLGGFEKARDVYEEAIETVATVRDFSQVYDAYTKFEESLVNAKMKEVEEGVSAMTTGEDELEKAKELYPSKYAEDDFVYDWYNCAGVVTSAQPDLLETDLDMSMARLDDILARRPLLLSSVILRQNPHHVNEWSHRVALFAGDPAKQIEIYSDAVKSIDPFQANNGKLERLWIAFAQLYEKHDDLANARVIFSKASQVNFKHVDALTSIWTEWIEMELRHGNYELALQTVRKGLTVPAGLNRQNLGWSTKEKGEASGSGTVVKSNLTCQQRLYKSTKLWSFYADLEENFGTLESTKAVYDQMFYLRIITPALVLSYATLMWEHSFFEDTFRIYEKGIAVFEYPHVYPIWMCYLHQFIARYGNSTNGATRKIERIRDLFEEAIKSLPVGAVETKKLYLLYAKYEEDHGLARRAMEIYNRACEAAPPSDRYELYIIYLARCAQRFGLTRTRDIYEAAIKNLPDQHIRSMACKYARLERTLGEIDRARGIYSYASSFCDPRVDTHFWSIWSEFEVQHGNHDTFKDMLRIKRSVLASFASNSIIAQAKSDVGLKPENSVTLPAKMPGMKEKPSGGDATKKAQNEQANMTDTHVGSKRRRDEEEEEAQEEEKSMGASARFAAAREKESQQAASSDQQSETAMDAEIDLDAVAADEEINIDEEDEEEDADITVKAVPDAVFGLSASNTKK